jgi:hypothetical protein
VLGDAVDEPPTQLVVQMAEGGFVSGGLQPSLDEQRVALIQVKDPSDDALEGTADVVCFPRLLGEGNEVRLAGSHKVVQDGRLAFVIGVEGPVADPRTLHDVLNARRLPAELVEREPSSLT